MVGAGFFRDGRVSHFLQVPAILSELGSDKADHFLDVQAQLYRLPDRILLDGLTGDDLRLQRLDY